MGSLFSLTFWKELYSHCPCAAAPTSADLQLMVTTKQLRTAQLSFSVFIWKTKQIDWKSLYFICMLASNAVPYLGPKGKQFLRIITDIPVLDFGWHATDFASLGTFGQSPRATSAQHLMWTLISFHRPQRSCSKVMFLHLSVILSTGGKPPLGRHPPAQCMLGYGQQAGGTHPTRIHSCFE